MVLVPDAGLDAPAVVRGAATLREGVVVGRDDATLSRGEVLARLERERADMAE